MAKRPQSVPTREAEKHAKRRVIRKKNFPTPCSASAPSPSRSSLPSCGSTRSSVTGNKRGQPRFSYLHASHGAFGGSKASRPGVAKRGDTDLLAASTEGVYDAHQQTRNVRDNEGGREAQRRAQKQFRTDFSAGPPPETRDPAATVSPSCFRGTHSPSDEQLLRPWFLTSSSKEGDIIGALFLEKNYLDSCLSRVEAPKRWGNAAAAVRRGTFFLQETFLLTPPRSSSRHSSKKNSVLPCLRAPRRGRFFAVGMAPSFGGQCTAYMPYHSPRRSGLRIRMTPLMNLGILWKRWVHRVYDHVFEEAGGPPGASQYKIALNYHHHELNGRKINIELSAGGGGNSERRVQRIRKKNKRLKLIRRKIFKAKESAKPRKSEPRQ